MYSTSYDHVDEHRERYAISNELPFATELPSTVPFPIAVFFIAVSHIDLHVSRLRYTRPSTKSYKDESATLVVNTHDATAYHKKLYNHPLLMQ